jgi:cytochrome b pre-mRNA-processing protein 3
LEKDLVMLLGLFGRRKPAPSVERVYGDIVAAARLPRLYRDMGVPDTVMGRFNALALHLALALRRLRALPPPADGLAQELVDRFFADLDTALREIGIGDVSVPKKMKALGEAFYGRAAAYDAALAPDAPADALEAALARNILDRPDEPAAAEALARHARSLATAAEGFDLDRFLSGAAFREELTTS